MLAKNTPVKSKIAIMSDDRANGFATNGCKYGEEDICPVWLGYQKQSFGYFGSEQHPIPDVYHHVFLKRRIEAENNSPSL